MVKTKHKKSRRSFLLPILVLLIGVVFLVIFKIFAVSGWEEKSRFTVVFFTKPLIVVSYNPADASLTSVSLPADTYVEVTHGYGSYRLGKVYEVGNLDGRGGEVLKSTVRELLGIPVDGFINFNEENFSDQEQLTTTDFLNKREKILGLKTFFKMPKTDISLLNLWRFYSRASVVKAGKITFVNLADTKALVAKTLPDQSNALIASVLQMDGLLRDLFHEDKIASENLKLAVLNSTNTVGLGERVARILTNMGIQVVSVANFSPTSNRCLLYTDKKLANFLTVVKLARVFACEIKLTPLPDVRADVVLIVGKTYSQELTLK